MGINKRPKKTRAKTLFYDLFIGEWVDVITKGLIEITEQSESGISSSKTPMVLSGYVIDIDDLFIYLGPEPFTVSQAVKKDEYISIAVVERQEKRENAEELGMPEDKDLN